MGVRLAGELGREPGFGWWLNRPLPRALVIVRFSSRDAARWSHAEFLRPILLPNASPR